MDYSSASNEVLVSELARLSGGKNTIAARKKSEFIYIIRQMGSQETPLSVFRGDLSGTKGRLALLTDTNLYLVASAFFKGLSFEKISFKDIISSDIKKGLLSCTLTVNLKGSQLTFNGVDKESALMFSNALNSLQATESSTITPQPNIPNPSPVKSDTDLLIEILERLEELKHFDVITNKEFSIIKEFSLSTTSNNKLEINILKLCDDIDKLSDLTNDGVLTKKEFTQQKDRLLAPLQLSE
ncbi:PH domain-containing protein [Providencia rettgeri]